MVAPAMPLERSQLPHPVVFDVEYPERLSRWKIFVRLIFVIPHAIVVSLLGGVMLVLTVVAWFGILFTGRYPKAFFDFTSGVMRWQSNVFAYVILLRDEYPPFSWEVGEYPLLLDIPRAERQSRFRLFIRAFAIFPNQIVFYFLQIALAVTVFISWWAILFTARYPRGLFSFNVGVMRWYNRMNAYLYLLCDAYPPYSINAYARPGNEVVSAVIGAPLFAAYIALQIFVQVGIGGGFSGGETVNVSVAPQSVSAVRPSASSGGIELTLLDLEINSVAAGYDVVTVDLHAEKDGWLPTYFSPVFLDLRVCGGDTYQLEEYFGDGFNWYWRHGEDDVTVFFHVPPGSSVCEIGYLTMRGRIRFRFN